MQSRTAVLASACVVIASTVSCAPSSAAGAAVPVPILRGSVTDPPDDTTIRHAPDLVGATIEVAGGTLTATVSFAPGTLTPSDTLVILMLDTDNDSSTGLHIMGDGSMGWDYAVSIFDPAGSLYASIQKADGFAHTVPVGSANVTLVSRDQARVSVPLASLSGNGHLKFKVSTALWSEPRAGVLDLVPDFGKPAYEVR